MNSYNYQIILSFYCYFKLHAGAQIKGHKMVKNFLFMITVGIICLRKGRRYELGGSAIKNGTLNAEFFPE